MHYPCPEVKLRVLGICRMDRMEWVGSFVGYRKIGARVSRGSGALGFWGRPFREAGSRGVRGGCGHLRTNTESVPFRERPAIAPGCPRTDPTPQAGHGMRLWRKSLSGNELALSGPLSFRAVAGRTVAPPMRHQPATHCGLWGSQGRGLVMWKNPPLTFGATAI